MLSRLFLHWHEQIICCFFFSVQTDNDLKFYWCGVAIPYHIIFRFGMAVAISLSAPLTKRRDSMHNGTISDIDFDEGDDRDCRRWVIRCKTGSPKWLFGLRYHSLLNKYNAWLTSLYWTDKTVSLKECWTCIAVDPADSCVVALRQLEQISEELPQEDWPTFSWRGAARTTTKASAWWRWLKCVDRYARQLTCWRHHVFVAIALQFFFIAVTILPSPYAAFNDRIIHRFVSCDRLKRNAVGDGGLCPVASLGPPASSTQTASRSLQPFLHGSLGDRQTTIFGP